MCGITGFFDPQGFNLRKSKTNLQRMSDRLAHRGPDDAGLWLDAEAGIALGHCGFPLLIFRLPAISRWFRFQGGM